MSAAPLIAPGPRERDDEARLEAAVERAARKWRRVAQQIRSAAPADVLRAIMVAGAVYAIGWLVWFTWPALLPFAVGGLVGYAVLPVVNALDRVLPRWLAALLAMAGVVALLLAFLGVLVPVLAMQLYRLFLALPTLDELREIIARLRQEMSALPAPVQDFIDQDVLDQLAASLRANAQTFLGQSVTLVISSMLGLLNTISFFLGLLVIPTWMLSIVTEQRTVVRAVNRLLPDWTQADFWAAARIVDRSFGAFLRGLLLVALAVGVMTYAGLAGLERLTGEDVRFPLVLAMLATLLQFVPQLGPILSAVLAAWAGFTVSVPTGLAILGLYFIIQRLVGALVGSRVDRRVSDLHPAVLVLAIVALSQLGPLWIFLAAPVTAVARDLWRYAFGRLGDPPRPAGVLPGEPVPARAAVAGTTGRVARPQVGPPLPPAGRYVPLTYRRAKAALPPPSAAE
jgi:predicted PurR-regulated permease PerM